MKYRTHVIGRAGRFFIAAAFLTIFYLPLCSFGDVNTAVLDYEMNKWSFIGFEHRAASNFRTLQSSGRLNGLSAARCNSLFPGPPQLSSGRIHCLATHEKEVVIAPPFIIPNFVETVSYSSLLPMMLVPIEDTFSGWHKRNQWWDLWRRDLRVPICNQEDNCMRLYRLHFVDREDIDGLGLCSSVLVGGEQIPANCFPILVESELGTWILAVSDDSTTTWGGWGGPVGWIAQAPLLDAYRSLLVKLINVAHLSTAELVHAVKHAVGENAEIQRFDPAFADNSSGNPATVSLKYSDPSHPRHNILVSWILTFPAEAAIDPSLLSYVLIAATTHKTQNSRELILGKIDSDSYFALISGLLQKALKSTCQPSRWTEGSREIQFECITN